MKTLGKKFSIVLILGLVLSILGTGVSPTRAATIDELKTKISDRTSEIERLEKEIQEYQGKIHLTQKQAASLATAIKELDLARKKLDTEIRSTQTKISRAESTIDKLELEIAVHQEKIEKNIVGIAETIKYLEEERSSSMIEVFLENDRISDAWENIDAVAQLQAGINDHLEDLRDAKKLLEGDKRDLEGARVNLVGLKGTLQDQKLVAEENKRSKQTLLSETKNQEAAYQKSLLERVANKKLFEKEIRDFEAQINIAINRDKLPSPGSGVLSWPLDDAYVTQKFGRTIDAKRLYTSGTHNGIDLRAAQGTSVRSAADGVVLGTGDTDQTCPWASYGKWVVVKHPNGLSTLYAHLSLIRVNAGQSVARGDIVGYSGSTGYSTAPHLHFTVFAAEGVRISTLKSQACSGATYTIPLSPIEGYLDPMAYL